MLDSLLLRAMRLPWSSFNAKARCIHSCVTVISLPRAVRGLLIPTDRPSVAHDRSLCFPVTPRTAELLPGCCTDDHHAEPLPCPWNPCGSATCCVSAKQRVDIVPVNYRFGVPGGI